MKKYKIAVIRGLREAEAFYYDRFQHFSIRFIAVGKEPDDFRPSLHNADLVTLPLKSVVPIFADSNRSWSVIDGIEQYLSDVDAVHIVEGYYFMWWPILQLIKKYNIPLITSVFETIVSHPARFIPPYSVVMNKVFSATDLFIARSKRSYAFLEHCGVVSKKISCVYNGVDTSFFKQKRYLGEKKIRLLFVGRLVSGKGIEDLIAVFERLIVNYPDIELYIAGNGPLRALIEEKSKFFSSIHYLGSVDYKELPELYQSADIFCSPVYDLSFLGLFKMTEERYGFTFVEAMSSGLPIVSTYCGSASDVLGDKNLLIPQRNLDQLYFALEKLIADPQLCCTIGMANRKRADRFFSANLQAVREENVMRFLFK